jgi:5-methylcytosine-specific restriction endonuclease McrA
MKLTNEQCICHELALKIARNCEAQERNLVEVLIAAEELDLPRAFELSSLFLYSVKILGLTESVTCMVINVARKSKQFPQLREAIQKEEVTISKVHKCASSLCDGNVTEWIAFAVKHSSREIEDRVREQNPDKPKTRKFHLSLKAEKLLKRAQSIESQRRKIPVSKEEALEAALELFIEKKDPVMRANRVHKKESKNTAQKNSAAVVKSDSVATQTQKQQFLGTVKPPPQERAGNARRKPLTAAEKNKVLARDRGCCQYVNQRGERCGQDYYSEIHHKIKVADGGTNEPNNLVTLCWFHHDIVHQLELPIELDLKTWFGPSEISQLG